MKWIVLVYLAMFTDPSNLNESDLVRLEFQSSGYDDCQNITSEINDIKNARLSKTPFVRSFYQVYDDKLLNEIKAECIYASSDEALPKWTDTFVGPNWYIKD